MKKLLTLLSILTVVALFTGCSFLPGLTPVNKNVNAPQVDLFNYDNVNYQADQVLVQVDSSVNLSKMMAAQDSQVLKSWSQIGWAAVKVPAGETALSFIKKLKAQPGVLMAEPNMEYQLNEVAAPTGEMYSQQWGFQNIHAEDAWQITTGSDKVIVAIVDTGVDMTNGEFEGKTFIDYWDATVGKKQMYDWNGHGTHVAGIAADDGRTGKIAGVAWDCPILPIRVENDEGHIYTTYLIDAMLWLADYMQNKPDYRAVANMSIGGRGYNFAFKDAIDYAIDAGVQLIVSAGNDSKRVPQYPSAYNGVIAVAASTPYDTKASFSTMGWWNSVAAPGVGIISTISTDVDPYGYASMQGTSMASPYVTGAAALLLSHYPTLTPLQIKNQLEQTARGTGFSEALGYGIIDTKAMLGDIKPMQYGSLDVQTTILSTEDTGWLGTGVVTVFNQDEQLVGFGTTGLNGNHIFHAMKPGTYTVNVSYYNMYKEAYDIQTSKEVTVTAEQTTDLNVTITVPTKVTRTIFRAAEALDGSVASKDITVTIENAGYYEFVTSKNTVLCDTIITLTDEEGNILAENDDNTDQYSRIGGNLEPGTYTITVADFNKKSVNCLFTVYSVSVTY